MAIAEPRHRTVDPSLRALAAIVVVGTVLRLVLAVVIGPNADETYIAVASRDVAWGYVDHPPMAMWLAALVRTLTGSESIFLLRLPFVALFAATTVLIYVVADFLFGKAAALPAILALSLCPLISIYFGTFVLTDGPFVFFIAAAACCLAVALRAERHVLQWWLATGASVGLAMLSKYIAALFPFGVVLFLATQGRYRHWFVRPEPWAAALLAVVLFAPALIWNGANDWVSFQFQASRAEPDLTFEPVRLIVNLALQAVYFFPPIWVGLMTSLAIGLKAGPQDDRSWFAVCLAVVPIAFFALVWLVAADDNKGFHWAAAGYLVLFPFYGHLLAERERTYPGRARWWFGASAAVLAIVMALYVGHSLTGWAQRFLPDPDRDGILADQVDWRDLRAHLEERGMLDPARYVAAATSWEPCVRIDYALAGALPVACVTNGPLMASEGALANLGARSVILVSRSPELAGSNENLAARFTSVSPLGPVEIGGNGVVALRVWLFLADGYGG